MKSARVVIVSFASSTSPVHPLIIDHFSRLCGPSFHHGYVELSDLPYRSWLSVRLPAEQQLQAVLGGVGLFLDGDLVAFHSGSASIATTTDLVMALAHVVAGSASDENAKTVTAYLDPIVRAFIAQRLRPPHKPPAEVPAIEKNHYEVLGISSGALRNDVDKAWRRIRFENAPDRLEGMSTKLRQVANDECLAANLARDAIYKERGWN